MQNKAMKKQLIVLTAFFMSMFGFSQTVIEKSSIDSGGANATVGTTTLLYTIGEAVVQENSNGSIHISEGFISAEVLDVLEISDYTELLGVSIYPNPTIDYVKINFLNNDVHLITLFDFSGKQLGVFQSGNGHLFSLDMQKYSSGMYLVLVRNTQKQQYKTFKLVKE